MKTKTGYAKFDAEGKRLRGDAAAAGESLTAHYRDEDRYVVMFRGMPVCWASEGGWRTWADEGPASSDDTRREANDLLDDLKREARNARTDAAVAAAASNPTECKLQRTAGEEPKCPKCNHRNAMLWRKWIEYKGKNTALLVCRDCNFACVSAD